jgi:hemolysin type calcium-binding protein
MKTKLLIPLALAAACALPSSALAGTATFDGQTFTFTGSQGEANAIVVDTTDYCDGLATAPCFSFSDMMYAVAPPAGCVSGYFGIQCPMPQTVRISAGDGVDIISDWNGASTIYAGSGSDLVEAHGGNDSIYGDAGGDTLIGGDGDDFESGGDGNDWLESYDGGITIDEPVHENDSFGSDILLGGRGEDAVSYGIRTDPLTLSLDGVQNDGADGEADAIASDVEILEGAENDDTLAGDANPNILDGKAGDDVLGSGAGDDRLYGGPGDDFLSANAGSDQLHGGGQDDLIVGGSGKDYLYGEYVHGCTGWAPCLPGDDDLRAQDGERDVVGCGYGTDTVELDKIDELWDDGCEQGTIAGGGEVGKPGGKPGGAPGKAAAGCKKFKGQERRICKRAANLMAQCLAVNGEANRKRCGRSIMRRGKGECRRMFRKRYRIKCVRLVRKIVKEAAR